MDSLPPPSVNQLFARALGMGAKSSLINIVRLRMSLTQFHQRAAHQRMFHQAMRESMQGQIPIAAQLYPANPSDLPSSLDSERDEEIKVATQVLINLWTTQPNHKMPMHVDLNQFLALSTHLMIWQTQQQAKQ